MFLTKSVTAMRPPVDALIPRHAERGFHAGRAVRSPVPGDEYAQRPECAGINDDTVLTSTVRMGSPACCRTGSRPGNVNTPCRLDPTIRSARIGKPFWEPTALAPPFGNRLERATP